MDRSTSTPKNSNAPVSTENNDHIVPVPAPDVEMSTIPTQIKLDDPFLVEFDEPYDAENPKNWSRARKWTQTDILSATGFARIMVSTIMAPALSTIQHQLSMTSLEAAMSLSAYMLATAFGPLLLGPFSELYGRVPVLHASNAWFFAFNLACGFVTTKGALISCRLLAGFGASAIYSLAGGVLGDVWRAEERGKSLGMYLLIPLLGAAIGPVIGGFIADKGDWRWMFWSTSAFQGVMAVMAWIWFRESYGPLILKKRAVEKRRETGDARWTTAMERVEGEDSVGVVLRRHLSRPLRLLTTHPAIQCMALLSGFNYGVLYIVLSTYADMWIRQYHQSVLISGLHYIAPALGEICASQIGSPLMDVIFRRLTLRANGETKPEYHLPLMLPGALIAAIGLFVYGWAANFRVYWLVCDIGIFINCFGSQLAGQGIQAYVIDSYPHHAGSATAASQVLRSLGAFSFPLFAPKMYAVLGYGWGNSLLGFATLAFGCPAPILMWMYGTKIRARSASSY